MKYVADTSIIIEKIITKTNITGTIIIPNAVIAELENQANKGQETGFIGLEEIQQLQELSKQNKIELKFSGARPTPYQIKYAKSGEIDAIIREIAFSEEAILITADKVQKESAKAFGLEVKFIQTKPNKEKLEIESYFDETTMSIHIKENCLIFAKKGHPGAWNLEKVSKTKISHENVQKMAKEIVEKAKSDSGSFVEISRQGSTIVQYKNYRIVIVKPPVSDGWEITAVKPIKKLNLDNYKLPEKILERIKTQARGVIIAGETGSGKSTLAQAIAEFYLTQNKIVKTVESPRDLILSDAITQYSKNFTTSEEIHDILFLSRPDNIIFDEMRDTPDFKIYTDLRLGGSNVMGVLHSATPIDAIQRFIGRLDTGMIPSVLDTIIFVEAGKIAKVLTLKMSVKVPSGMTEADLARPVIEVKDFTTNEAEFEIYSYGEETVVVPVSSNKNASPTKNLAEKQLQHEIQKYVKKSRVELLSANKAAIYVPESDMARIIGKGGSNIEQIEKDVGISIDVRPMQQQLKEIDFEVIKSKKNIIFKTSPNYVNNLANIFIDDELIFSAKISKKGEIKVRTKSELGNNLLKSINKKIIMKI